MRSRLAIAMLLALGSASFAADLPVKTPVYNVAPCIAGSCSGWYAGFGILGDGTNVDIVGNGINGSVFSAGGTIKAQGGYQLWTGAFFAAFELGAGYEFTTPASAGVPVVTDLKSRFVGTELIKLGYNFFPSTQTAITTPSQAPIPLTVPANLLASTTPYFVFGGLQRRGITEWVNGAGVETVIASGWSSSAEYLFAPAQQGLPATNIIQLKLDRHF